MTVGQLLSLLGRQDISDELIIGIEDDDNKYSTITRADICIDKNNEIYSVTLVVGEA